MSMRTAREHLQVARALPDLPKVSEAFARGTISYSKVRAIARVATPETEGYLLSFARGGTASHLERLVGYYRRSGRREATEVAARQYDDRFVHMRHDDDGALVIEARLPPELGAVVQKALDAVGDALQEEVFENERGLSQSDKRDGTAVPRRPVRTGQQRADALVAMAETALASGVAPLTGGERYQVHVHIDESVLPEPSSGGRCGLEDGPALAPETVRRIACDSSRVGVHEDGAGNVLDIGRRTRQIPPAMRRALRIRDGGCRFPGCTSRRFVDGHHIEHWADGGETKLSNLVLLCRHHHTAVHEGGYGVEVRNGTIEFTRPDGRTIPAAPGPAPVDPSELVERQALLGIEPRTIRPEWYGERPDYAWAVDALMELQRRKPTGVQ